MNRILTIPIILMLILAAPSPVSAADDAARNAEEERNIGHLFDYYMTESFTILNDDALSERIKEITDRISNASGNPNKGFHLRIINDQLPIVSSFPGYIYVSTGMLDLLDNEAKLAAVIAHAVAHINEKDQYHMYVDAEWKDRVANFTGHIMPLLVFSGMAGAAIVTEGVATAATATFSGAVAVQSGLYSTALVTEALNASDVHERAIVHSMLLPYIYLPDTKTSLTVMTFLTDIYAGYGRNREIHADNLAMGYLHDAGYDPASMVSALETLDTIGKAPIAMGRISHLPAAEPGLKERIENATGILENYR